MLNLLSIRTNPFHPHPPTAHVDMKTERRRLKVDKFDLLAHVKQLCASLHDKEQEMREFIRNYEQRLRDTDATQIKSSAERERERWSLLKHAREESDRSLALATQLNARDAQLAQLQEALLEARRQLSAATGCSMSDQESLMSFGGAALTPPSATHLQLQQLQSHQSQAHGLGGLSQFGSMVLTDGAVGGGVQNHRLSSDRESMNDSHAHMLMAADGGDQRPCITIDQDSISIVSSNHNMYQCE